MKGSKGQSQAGGESGKQLDQESGAGDSVLVSVHVELDFANEAWLLALSRTPTLPTALASSPSRTLTSLSLMTVPRTLLLNSWLQMPGNTLNLTFLTSHETTDLNWLLWHTGNRSPVLLQPGSRVSLTSHPGQVVLSIFNISHEWAVSLNSQKTLHEGRLVTVCISQMRKLWLQVLGLVRDPRGAVHQNPGSSSCSLMPMYSALPRCCICF
ncbi:adhesion G-protein coupled receptor F3-like isoform X6 [Manis javanica]|uniref:adhesion G-protein coupled receptor F3-like isoform X6 n=1 Tax=Manis javanica TaxID=9974 RepID=UPI003C6CD401